MLSTPALSQTSTVTYDQILAHPNDLQLNLTYAQQQSAANNLEQAAGALERLLLLQPNWDSVRLFYARVLVRLDDLDGARRELDILSKRPLSGDQADEVSRLSRQIDHNESPFHGSFGVTIGARVDSNPNAATSSDIVLSGNTPVPVDPDERVDGAFLAAARLRLEYQPSRGSDSNFYAEMGGRLREQFEVDSADFAMARGEVGANIYIGDLKLNPKGFYQPYFVGDDLVLEEAGGELDVEYDLSSRLTLLASGEFVGQDYHSTDSNPTRDDRDGWRADVGGGFRAKLSGTNTFTTVGSYLRKEADVDAYSYEGPQVYAADQQLLGKGQYLLGQFWYWHFDYDEPDPTVTSAMTREDDRYKVRAAYGLPLRTAFEAVNLKVPDEIGRINFEVAGSYYKQDSNIPNFDNDDFSGEVTLTRNFQF